MKPTAILGTLLCAAASVTAAPGAALRFGRQASSYNVANFTASCIPHSVLCDYEFDVVASTDMFPTECSLLLQGDGDLLPPVELTGCENNAYAWSVASSNGTLSLTVTSSFNSRVNLTGTHLIPSSQLVLETNGASVSQRYVGPTAFNMSTYGTQA
ncbi:hypothetical protein F5Y15DRAFT_201494 [Xylariaceae sp. FL0016]|nr:hypothetical protein F5Y15DRAFT_201494 [Xylariaceae sp. FL0016]